MLPTQYNQKIQPKKKSNSFFRNKLLDKAKNLSSHTFAGLAEEKYKLCKKSHSLSNFEKLKQDVQKGLEK